MGCEVWLCSNYNRSGNKMAEHLAVTNYEITLLQESLSHTEKTRGELHCGHVLFSRIGAVGLFMGFPQLELTVHDLGLARDD